MGTATAANQKLRNRVVSLREFDSQCNANPPAYVVEGLIPEESVNIAAGDSGLGKSAWAYQLGLCVAWGMPFLGLPTKKGPVLYIDLENGRSGIQKLYTSLSRHLGASGLSDSFYLLTDRDEGLQLESIIAAKRPTLVIIDSLRAWNPEAEEKNRNAARVMMQLREFAKAYKVAFLIIHHIKKPSENYVQVLEDTSTMTWLLQACGARALINQADVRLAFDNSSGVRRAVADINRKSGSQSGEVGLVVKGFARLRGEFGPTYLARDFDDEGEALGYRPMKGIELLFNDDQQAAFPRLPNEFTFTEGRRIYERSDQPTRDFLQKCIRVGILKHVGRAYRKPAE